MNDEIWVEFIEWMTDNDIDVNQAYLREKFFVQEFSNEHKITKEQKKELIEWAKESFQDYIDDEKQEKINESLEQIKKDF